MHSRKNLRLYYAIIWLLIAAVILLIATVFREHAFIRGHVIDVFAVPFVAFFLLTINPMSARVIAIVSWCIALMVEFSQYFKLADALGLAKGSFLHQFLGSTFSWNDLLMYSIGAVLTYLIVIVLDKS